MNGIATIQKISDDLDFLKERILKIEEDLGEINSDFHQKVKPEYLHKLKSIDQGRFFSEEEFERELAKE